MTAEFKFQTGGVKLFFLFFLLPLSLPPPPTSSSLHSAPPLPPPPPPTFPSRSGSGVKAMVGVERRSEQATV